MRRRLHAGLEAALGPLVVNGHADECLPGNLNVSFPGVDGTELLLGLRAIALSSGAACSSRASAPSHVLKAIGASDDLARASLRFGLGRFNTMEEVEFVIDRTVAQVERLRAGALATEEIA